MAYNLNKFTKIAELLDKAGKYAISDKIDNLIKTSQNLLGTMPEGYAETGPPRTGHPLIDAQWEDMGDTAGSVFGEFRFSPYRSDYGPQGFKELPTLSPAQYAELLKTPQGRKYIAQMNLIAGQEAAQMFGQSNEALVNVRRFISQNLAPGVPRERQQEFLNNILPTTMSEQVSRILQTFPINQWSGRLAEFSTIANENPQYSNQIRNLINSSVRSGVDKIKRSDEERYNKILTDPKYKDFATKFSL